jgi:hypothetical protein
MPRLLGNIHIVKMSHHQPLLSLAKDNHGKLLLEAIEVSTDSENGAFSSEIFV